MENIRRATTSENKTEVEVSPEPGQKKIWVDPEEEEFILSQRAKKEELHRHTEALMKARLQLEGWRGQPVENPQREQSVIYWEQQVQSLEGQIRSVRSTMIFEKQPQLQPAPETMEQAQALPQNE